LLGAGLAESAATRPVSDRDANHAVMTRRLAGAWIGMLCTSDE
jgi:hypothetical protein